MFIANNEMIMKKIIFSSLTVLALSLSLNPEYHFRNLYRYGNPNYIVTAYWNKTLIWQGNKIPTSVVVNGYKYSPGAIISSDQENNDVYEAYYYSICREAI